jgi:hypothetical protein
VENNLAVLIDFENIAAGTEKDGLGRFDVEAVLSRLSDKGRILIARSYADWGRFARFKQGLLMNNVSMMELTSHGMQDKNRADIALVVEGLELAFTKPYIDTFVIVSGDSDFTPMVLKMRELDKRVIGVGCRSSTSRLLIQACDEFIFYDNLAARKKPRTKAPTSKDKMDLETAMDLLVDALAGLQRESPTPPLAGIVKSAMLRKSSDFSESDLGFSSFARFLERARKANKVLVIRDDKSGGYRVDSVGSGGNGDGDGDARDRARDRDDDAAWMDPYLPAGCERYVDALSAAGLNPLAAPTRKSILQAVEESVEERNKRKRRVTAQFVQEDVRRRLRKTNPDVPARAVRHIFNGLMRSGTLLHRDGSPVRTGSAPFSLDKTAEELNEALADIYVDELHQARIQPDVALLAELFFGDRTQTRRIEEAVAYLQAHADDDVDEDEVDEDDLDALLLADGAGNDAPKRAAKKEEPKKPAAKKAADDDDSDSDDSDGDEAPKAAPKKRTRKKKPTKADEAKADDDKADKDTQSKADDAKADKAKATKAESDDAAARAKATDAKLKAAAEVKPEAKDAAADDAEAKPRRRRTRKKAPEPEATEDDDDMDDLLSTD